MAELFDHLAAQKARIECVQADELSQRIVNDIMRAFDGEDAKTLKLYAADGRYMGGWARCALAGTDREDHTRR